VAPRPADLPGLIADLLDNPQRLARLREGARRVKRPDAAAHAAIAILSLIATHVLAGREE
jgi:UDP-N-acetylglucosamine:LPS N-acetylglucosamine transferase